MNIIEILQRKYPGTVWSLTGTEYDGLEWLDENVKKPTKSQLEKVAADVEYEVEFEKVQMKRQMEYAKHCDPLFFGAQRGENTQQQWLDAVESVKVANPYPVKQ